jgi:hypothetical protein
MPDYPIIRWETEGGATLPADDNGPVRVPMHPDQAEPQPSLAGMQADAHEGPRPSHE